MLQSAPKPGQRPGLIPKFILILLILQPLLDVAGYWQKELGVFNLITLLIRMSLSAVLLLLAFRGCRRKVVYLGAGIVVCLYLAGHFAACALYPGGVVNFPEDLMEQARLLFLPITALCLLSLLRQDPEALPALKTGLALDLALILCVELLALVTGTDPHSYPNQQMGVLGWFLWANSQSAILSALCPMTIAWVWRRSGGKLLPTAAAAAVGFGLLFFLGTRLAYAALAVSGLGMSLGFVLQGKAHRRCAATVLALTLLFVGLLPLSPMHQARSIQANNAALRQELIDRAVEPYLSQEERDSGLRRSEEPQALAAGYRYYLQGLVDRFGLDAVAECYDYSYAVSDICDRRRMLLTGCQLLMKDASPLSYCFGLELGIMRQPTVLFQFNTRSFEAGIQYLDPENDFLGVYYLGGAAGLLLVCSAIVCAGAALLWLLLRRPKRLFQPETLAFALAFCFCLISAWFTVSTLRRNNASIYFAAVIAVLVHLTLSLRAQKEEGSPL